MEETMRRSFFLKSLLVMAALIAAMCAVNSLRSSGAVVSAQAGITPGALQVIDPNGKPKAVCPLKHTDVKAQISGFLSRVVVTQEFENPFKEKIEAVYTFPLPQNAAVDDMTMVVGDRTVRGKILRREEAQAVYEAAKSNGDHRSFDRTDHLHAELLARLDERQAVQGGRPGVAGRVRRGDSRSEYARNGRQDRGNKEGLRGGRDGV